MADGAPAFDTLEIRSFRTVFDLERRVYRIDRLRLNPGGVPVRGMLYCVALLCAIAVAARLPLIGAIVRLAPWYLRYLALPVGAASLLTLIRVDGRPFHLVVLALVRHRLTPTYLRGLGRAGAPRARWHPAPLLLLPDGSDHRVRRLRYIGPGAVLVGVAHERIEWGSNPMTRMLRRPHLTVRQLADGRELQCAQVVELSPGCRLTLSPARAQARPDGPRRRRARRTAPRGRVAR